jgi:hypothetical protein
VLLSAADLFVNLMSTSSSPSQRSEREKVTLHRGIARVVGLCLAGRPLPPWKSNVRRDLWISARRWGADSSLRANNRFWPRDAGPRQHPPTEASNAEERVVAIAADAPHSLSLKRLIHDFGTALQHPALADPRPKPKYEVFGRCDVEAMSKMEVQNTLPV